MKIVWNQIGDQSYETGVDRGVLYPSEGPGVVWNGLVSVNEASVGGERESYYFDGVKYLDFIGGKDYQATLEAFTAPAEFAPCIGNQAVVPGFFVTRQPKARFGFSYRTLIGSNFGYKIHLVYNALATPDSRDYQTISDDTEPTRRTWVIDAVPEPSTTHRPTTHFIIDSTKTHRFHMDAIERLLYGTVSATPVLPPLELLVEILKTPVPIPVEEPPPGEPVPPSGDSIDGGTPFDSTADRVDGGTPFNSTTDRIDGGDPGTTVSPVQTEIDGGSPASIDQPVIDGGSPSTSGLDIFDGGTPNG